MRSGAEARPGSPGRADRTCLNVASLPEAVAAPADRDQRKAMTRARVDHATALAAFADIVERTRVSRGERSERYAFELMRIATAEVRAGDFDSA